MSNKLQAQTGKARFKGIENAYVLVSAYVRFDDDPVKTPGTSIKASMSFLYDAGDVAAEWEPEYGPIQVWHRCEPDAEGAREHYYFDFVDDRPWNFSQLAVDRHGLQGAFARGNYVHIFSVLRDWAQR